MVPLSAQAPARRLVLASASPARLTLLRAAGFRPDVVPSHVEEDGVAGLSPAEAARSLAERKADAVAEHLTTVAFPDGARAAVGRSGRNDPPGALSAASSTEPGAAGTAAGPVVVGCDTLLVIDGAVRGKPSSLDKARGWWQSQRGRQGILITGHCVIDVAHGRRASAVSETVVRFADPSDEEIEAYLATGEPLHVAGAFTIDGLGAPFVEGIDGSHSTVVGLSLPLLRRLLADLGIPITDLWGPHP